MTTMHAPRMPLTAGLDADGSASAKIGITPARTICVAFNPKVKNLARLALPWQRLIWWSTHARISCVVDEVVSACIVVLRNDTTITFQSPDPAILFPHYDRNLRE